MTVRKEGTKTFGETHCGKKVWDKNEVSIVVPVPKKVGRTVRPLRAEAAKRG